MKRERLEQQSYLRQGQLVRLADWILGRMMRRSSETVEDPSFRAVGVILVDGDEAEVDPLPESVGRGVSVTLLESFEDMGNRLRQIEADPDKKAKVIEAFMDGWDGTRVQKSIMERVAREARESHLGE
jgi:hypothetical protein